MALKLRQRAFTGVLAITLLASVFAPSFAETDEEIIQQFGFTSHLCTAENVPDEKRAKACEEREGLWEELFELGYTYGCEGDSDDDRYWRKDCG